MHLHCRSATFGKKAFAYKPILFFFAGQGPAKYISNKDVLKTFETETHKIFKSPRIEVLKKRVNLKIMPNALATSPDGYSECGYLETATGDIYKSST